MAKRRRKSSKRKFNLASLNFDVEMQPILLSAIFFGFAISYSQFSKAVSISSALTSFVLAVAVSYIFLFFVYKLFSKFLFYKNAEMMKNHNPTNYLFIIALAVITNGTVLFLDLMNFDLKFKRSYKPFLKEGWRSGGGYETTYRSALLVSLILFSVIISIIHNYSENIITYYLMKLLIWTLVWSAIPTAVIFSAFLMLTGRVLKNARFMVPETGGAKMLFANRRMWIFFGTLSFVWGLGLLMNVDLLGLFMMSLLAAIVMLLLLLVLWDFRTSPSKFFSGKSDVTK